MTQKEMVASPSHDCFVESQRRPGSAQAARYSKGRFLGKGGFAKCYEAQRMDTGEVLCAKIVAKSTIAKPRARAKLQSEIAIHRKLEHEHVVRFCDHYEDADHVYIILELCPNQTLNDYVRRRPDRRMTEPEAIFYMYELIRAVQYLHYNRVIHRDLKLGNLLLDAGMHLKVGDFGLAAQLEFDGDKKHTICGTPNYIAPEILEGKSSGHSFEVDIWALGVIIYIMLIGKPPFETSDVKTTYRRIRHTQYTFPDDVPISPPARDLITRILRHDPRTRPGLDDILRSTWFQSTRLPPVMPATLASKASASSPRVASSRRSETPERGTIDYAHIDSPAHPFPLRERSPVSARSPSPFTASSKQPRAMYGGQRAASPGLPTANGNASARPPLACRTNDENAAPPPSNVEKVAAHLQKPQDCKESRAHPVSLTPPARPRSTAAGSGQVLRVQAPHSASCGAFPRVSGETTGLHATSSYSPAPLHQAQPVTPRPVAAFAAGRDVSPVGRIAQGRQVPPPPTVPPPPGALRTAAAAAGSPRQACATTPIAVASPRFAQTSPAAVRTDSHTPLALSSRGSAGVAEKSPDFGGRGASASRGDGGGDTHGLLRGSSRTPLQPLGQRMANCIDHCASSPALSLDAFASTSAGAGASAPTLMGSSSYTPPSLGLGLHVAGTQIHKKLESARSVGNYNTNSARSTAASSEASGGNAPYAPLVVPTASALPELWVSRWVDYSSKYGVGYSLSDGSIGVYFNDSTKIILGPAGHQFDYITRRTQDKPEVRTTHGFDDYPKDLQKKVTLLRHFKNYMLTDCLEKKDGVMMGESGLPHLHLRQNEPANANANATPRDGQPPQQQQQQQLYVKKWMRNEHAIHFQLCNKIVQVIFFDRTELVLSSKAHMVTYVDKRGQRSTYPLSGALDVPCPEISRRIRYTKDILTNFLCGRSNGRAADKA